MGQRSFRGIPASKSESHFQKQTGTFFHVRLRRYDNWVLRLGMTVMGDGKVFFFQKTKYVLRVLIFKTRQSFLVD